MTTPRKVGMISLGCNKNRVDSETALGLPCGKMVLSVAVLSILLTAPLGAFGMDATYRRLLNRVDKGRPLSR